MSEFKDRLKEARTRMGIPQSELAKEVGVHVTNISRYERGENKPSTEVMAKLAFKLGVSVDFLMSGSLDDTANQLISDKVLLEQFKKVEQLPDQKKLLIKEFLDAFIMKAELQSKFA